MTLYSFFLFYLMENTSNLLENQGMDFTKELLHMAISLLLILGLIFATVIFLKKFMASRGKHMNKNTEIKILEKRALHQKASLYLIEVENKKILISDSTSGINFLCHLPTQEEALRNPSPNWKALFSSKEPNS